MGSAMASRVQVPFAEQCFVGSLVAPEGALGEALARVLASVEIRGSAAMESADRGMDEAGAPASADQSGVIDAGSHPRFDR